MPVKELEIRKQEFEYIDYKEFNDLQGKLKELSELNYKKLRESILKYKFSFPVFAWRDSKSKIWIMDAHQRIKVIAILDNEGYIIPKLPTVFIEAKNKREAKELLLLQNSNYGKLSQSGMDIFINEVGFEIDISMMDGILEIPELKGWDLGIEDEPNEREVEEQKTPNQCPKCGYEW